MADSKKDKKLLISLGEELLNKINDYRFDNRIETKSEAVRVLIKKGLEAEGIKGNQKKTQ